jgi:serine protease Do
MLHSSLLSARSGRMSFLLVASALLWVLAGCATKVPMAPLKRAIEVPSDAQTRSVQFLKLVNNFPKGEPLGDVRFGLLCLPGKKLDLQDGRVSINEWDFAERFNQELEKEKYQVERMAPAGLFDEPMQPRADLMVVGQIESLQVNACSPMSDFGNWRDAKGGAYIKVLWQLYGGKDRKVQYEVATEGSFYTDSSVVGGMSVLLSNAFAAAARNLMADPGFHGRVVVNSAKPKAMQTMAMLPDKAAEERLGAMQTASMASLVTVTSGQNRSSGFVATPDGFVITSQQAIGESFLVKVRLSSGRETLGVVMSRDSKRNLALVKLTEKNLPFAELRLTNVPELGEMVNVFSGALATEGEKTPGRGLLGEPMTQGGLKYLSSSIKMQPQGAGTPLFDTNAQVVGVAVVQDSGDGKNQNAQLFVPIGDALASLGLKLK